mgnify:FL=1
MGNKKHHVFPKFELPTGMVPEDENKMRCVACFAVIELHSIQTEGCIIKAHKRYACYININSNIMELCIFTRNDHHNYI